MSEFVDYYATLQVHPNADPEVIEKAYKALIFKHHPDRGGDGREAQLLNEAYGVLRDPHSRANYNVEWGMAQATAQVASAPSATARVDGDHVVATMRRLDAFALLLDGMRADARKRWMRAHAGTLLGGNVVARVLKQKDEFRDMWWPRYKEIWRDDPDPPAEGRLSFVELFRIVDVPAANKKFSASTWLD